MSTASKSMARAPVGKTLSEKLQFAKSKDSKKPTEINWLHLPLLTLTPLLALYAVLTIPLRMPTLLWSLLWYLCTALGITAGYHRLWSHKSYKATPFLEFLLVFWGSGAVEGSIRWWCRDHRAHHRYSDTDRDPYNVKEGFWWAHIGWMLFKQDPALIGRADIRDLNAKWYIRFQHRHYLWIAPFTALAFPSLVAGLLWGDYAGGFWYGGIVRLLFVHHATFLVNSLAHYVGDKPYENEQTAVDSWLTALLTLGEGYHNFHHEYPADYRNGIRYWQYDPTKWMIWTCAKLGLAYDLNWYSENEIKKARVQVDQRKLDARRERLFWGKKIESLPSITRDEFERRGALGEALVLIDGVVYDVTSFFDEHPGGADIVKARFGKDATADFNGKVYNHSKAANNLLMNYRTYRIADE